MKDTGATAGLTAVSLFLLLLLPACQGLPTPDSPASGGRGTDAGDLEPEVASVRLPKFEDYPVTEIFTGKPADVDLASHPEARRFRTRLRETFTDDTRFAGHYRIVRIGCGTTCQSIWAVDLRDGSVHFLFTASVGVVFRPDSRLIVQNDPAYYEGLLEEVPVAEVERLMELYGPPQFWVENEGEFEQIASRELRLDPQAKKIVAAFAGRSSESWQCRNDLEVRCFEGSCEAETGDAFTPMSVSFTDSGAMSVCAYSGCWEGSGEIVRSGGFLVLIGHQLEFSTSPGSESAKEDIVIVIDRTDGIATLKAGQFAHPLRCTQAA